VARQFSKHFQDFRSLQKRSASRLPGSGRSGHVAWLATPCDGDAAERIHEGLQRGVLVDPALLGETEDEAAAPIDLAKRGSSGLHSAAQEGTTSRFDGAAQPGSPGAEQQVHRWTA
jgi:hypothetical protein